jgi:hypothetical protein
MPTQSSKETRNKDHLRGTYSTFIKSQAGQDLLKQAQLLEKSFVLQGVKATTSEEKAHALCRMEGLITIRDYILRMCK